MIFAFLKGLKSADARSSGSRLAAKSRRPTLEAMESRHMLSGTPLMLIDNPSVTEGTGDSSVMTFTVSLMTPPTKAVSVNYRTVNLAARASSDFVATSGQLNFEPGQMSRTVSVSVAGDATTEPNESFYLALSGAKNAYVIKSLGVGTIVDDDATVAPEMSISDVSMHRGLSGYRYMYFTVSLNTSNFSTPISVTASTQAITARAGADFDMKSETLTFNPGETTKQFAVRIYGTSTVTSDKIFYVNLTNSNVSLRRPTGGGIIRYGA